MKEILLASDTNRLVAELTFVSWHIQPQICVLRWRSESFLGIWNGVEVLRVSAVHRKANPD